ncbi:tetratricopeptide repeat protein [Treponema vincentii]|uniref:tetratricopeptide repeat protein n=1 Tax=Treponema vincentii TaxID=69710 RepID=UPI0020A3C01F|nr:tetratricopeptide repeat protein [Treponema vincentii]UTC47114.1 tetratricopeptide repeat protein [Treponema vincentii]
MNDLYKYLIGTAAGIVLCLLIWGGYSLLSGRGTTNNVPISRTELDGSAIGTASGRSSDILGNNGSFSLENDDAELTPEQQERLLAAQAANESLAKQYGGQDGNGAQNQQGFRNEQTTAGTDSGYPGVFGNDALALNRGTQERAAVQTTENQKLEESRNRVRDYIVQGKSAAQKNQPANALAAFEQAGEAMPDDKDFEAASYQDIASSLFLLSKTVPNAQTAQTVRDEAERYIKKSLAVRDNADARELYSTIIAENRKAAETKRQETLLAQQQAADRARKEEQAEQQRRQVVELIGQGKNAVNRRQLNNAVSAFDKAAASMPDNKQFASDSYSEMADAMLNLAQHLSNPNDVNTALNKAESYIKEALATQTSSNARNLYAKILDARKEQERLAQARAEAQRKQQEQAAQAAAQKKAEEQRKQQEQAAQAAAQKKAEEQRKQQEQAAQAAAQKKAEEQQKQPKTAAHKQVENLIAQGTAAAQRKQLNNAILALDRAGRFMPNDNDFAEESYRKMADAMFNLAENLADKQTKASALNKADEYIKKALAAKNTAESQALAARITEAQSANQTNTAAKPQTAQQSGSAARQTQADAARQQNNTAGTANNGNAANAQAAAAQARAAAEAEAAKKVQAELLAKKREVDTLVQQGKKAAGTGNFAEAQRAFNKAAAQMPDGDAVFAAEQYREMADVLQGFAKTAPTHREQSLKDAADYIKKSIASKDDDAKSHYIYAQIADSQNNTALTVQELEAARRFDPQNAQYNYELGRKYFEQKKYPQARSCFEQAVKSNPQFEAAFFNLGITHKIMNANDAALTAFSKAAALKSDYVRAWIEIARVQDKKRNYGEAISNYQKALALEPSNTSALKEMAQVYSKQKNAAQAERYFKEALALGDTDPVTYYNLASVQLELDKTAEALQNAQKALASNDKDARFLYTYGLALEKSNRLHEAEDYYTRAIAADGKYGKPRINLGRIQLEAGHLDSAEQHLLAGYRAESSNFEVNMNLGKLYGLKKQYGKAIDYYTNAIKIMPKDVDARQNLAAVYLSAGLKENARDTYQALIKMNPQAWDSYYELGKVYISLDNKAEAKAIFEQLLKQRPNYRNAAEVRKLLVNL